MPAWRSCSTTFPPTLHLVITTRADPALPLARLRARGELVEIRAADLRFTPDEAAAYFNGVMTLGLTAARRRDAGGPDRRLDRRPPAGGPVDAGARRHRRLHRRLRRRRPLHRRLPRRGGLAASTRGCPELPAADIDPGPHVRTPVRCRHRAGRWQGDAGGARSAEPVPHPARRPAPLVSLPPPVRGCAAGAPARRAARARAGAPSAGHRVVRAGGRTRGGHPPRPRGQGLREGRRPGRARHPGDAPARQESRRVAGSTPSPSSRSGAARAERRVRRVAPGAGRGRRRRGGAWRTPSAG